MVIGYGNDLRRDDGAGRLLAACLAESWRAAGHAIDLHLTHQLTPELAIEMAAEGVDRVLFVDARQGGSKGIEVAPIQRENRAPSLGHHLEPALLLAYAATLGSSESTPPPVAWQLTVPGVDFGHGEQISEEVVALIDETVGQAATLWQQIRQSPSAASTGP
ncbi:MAG: hydrogenase maturation protease [Caldilineaceae bacterium]|nr:hydrogenase maturation protease [Caldilineaceae bacterium]